MWLPVCARYVGVGLSEGDCVCRACRGRRVQSGAQEWGRGWGIVGVVWRVLSRRTAHSRARRLALFPVTVCGKVHNWPGLVLPVVAQLLFRRAKALSAKGDYDEADADLSRALELDPSVAPEVTRERAANMARRRGAAVKQKQQFSNFFGRSAGA